MSNDVYVDFRDQFKVLSKLLTKHTHTQKEKELVSEIGNQILNSIAQYEGKKVRIELRINPVFILTETREPFLQLSGILRAITDKGVVKLYNPDAEYFVNDNDAMLIINEIDKVKTYNIEFCHMINPLNISQLWLDE